MWLDRSIARLRYCWAGQSEDPRLTTLRKALIAAIESVDADIVQLEDRLQADRGWLSVSLGNEDGSRVDREPEQERLLRGAEVLVRQTTHRLAQLRALRCSLADARPFLNPKEEKNLVPSSSVSRSCSIATDRPDRVKEEQSSGVDVAV